jgi:VanZ family protein
VIIAVLTLQSPEATLRLSGGMQRFAKNMLPDASSRWTIDMHWFRTLLHLPLYFLLGCAVGYSVRGFWQAAGICSVIALADETLKIFLPTREFQAIDLGFDAIGFLMGIGIVFLLRSFSKGIKL